MRISWVKKIYSDGGHNGFTGLGYYKGKYYLAFRNASGHVTDKAEQIIMVSDNGKDWKVLHKRYFEGSNGGTVDYRDSHFLPYGDKLFLYSFCTPVVDGKREERYTQVQMISPESEIWTEPRIIQKNCAFWKPFIMGNHLYFVGYSYEKERQTYLFHSSDGLEWEKTGPVIADASETCLYSSQKDTLIAFIRTEVSPYHLKILQSEKPFIKWIEITEIPQIIQCPHVLEWNKKVLFIGRYRPDYMETADRNNPSFSRHRTKIWEFENNTLKEVLELPSMGDNSYVGTALTPEGSLLVSYYSQHECGGGVWKKEMPADIFVACIKIS